jgi:hypothetical protein
VQRLIDDLMRRPVDRGHANDAIIDNPLSLESGLTLDEKRAKLRDIIDNPDSKDADKVKAIELDAKIAGHLAPDKSIVVTVNGDAYAPQLQQIALNALAEYNRILGNHVPQLPQTQPQCVDVQSPDRPTV